MTSTRSTASTNPATATGALAFSGVSMRFPDGTHALDTVDLDVAPGEFVTIVGPSGCGKSTLLRIASGLERQSTGTVDVDRSGLGYVFQDATLLQWRNIRANVSLFAELERMPKAELSRRVDENLELVGLTSFAKHYPKQLSGGMRMRASLARSLVMEPDVFLFDEPFGALDEISRERLNDELLALFQAKRFAALFITHSIYEAVFLSTRVHVMSARPGRLIASFDVPFEYPRSGDLRFEPAFNDLAGDVSHALRAAHA